jgi:hypothetical protein
VVLVEIEKGLIPDAAVCYHPGLWMFALYDAGTFLSWFAPSSLGTSVKVCGSVIVDGDYYTRVGAINALYDKTYCQIENTVFVKTPDFTPLWYMEYVRTTYSVGLSDSAAFVRNTIYYKPVLIYQLAIQEKVDNNNYGSMVFRSDTLRIRNDNGEYDDVTNYFGNLVRVHTYDNGTVRDWFELYIKNVSITSNLVTFTCGDKRERLKFKVPNTRFTKEAYPFLKDDLVGELKQDVYGNCQWVKCVCVDELDIYAEEAPAETE